MGPRFTRHIGRNDPFLRTLRRRLPIDGVTWSYGEVDPDVFGEELLEPPYAEVERIAAVVLTMTLHDR